MEKLDIWKRRNIVFTFKYWLADLLSMGRGSNYRNECLRDAYIEDCCNYIGKHFELPLPHFVSEEDHDFEDFEEFQNVMLSGIWKEVDFFEAWEGDSCCVTEPIYNYIHQETAKKLKEEKNNVICDDKGL